MNGSSVHQASRSQRKIQLQTGRRLLLPCSSFFKNGKNHYRSLQIYRRAQHTHSAPCVNTPYAPAWIRSSSWARDGRPTRTCTSQARHSHTFSVKTYRTVQTLELHAQENSIYHFKGAVQPSMASHVGGRVKDPETTWNDGFFHIKRRCEKE